MTGRALRHSAFVFGGFTVLFCWVFARPLLEGSYLSESDLYDYYLPVFLAPATLWSPFEFAGMPAFADPESTTFYPLHLLFSRVIGSWTGFIASAYVLGACFMYAYVYQHTRSAAAAALSGIAYALSEAMLERMAHPGVVHALAWLPLLVLSLDKIHAQHHRPRWIAIGAVAAANCVLAGHPQVAVYIASVCGAYAVAGLLTGSSRLPLLAAMALMAVTGVMLAALTLLPLAELSRYMARQSVGFEEFVSYSNTPAEMLSIFFPTIAHVGREAPTYVGLGVLMLAPLGVWRTTNWRAVFWLAVTVVGLLLGAGASTPLAGLVYELPLQDRFRIVARHLMFAAFALAVLAAFGLAAIEQARVSRRTVVTSISGVLLAMAGAGLMLSWWPQEFQFESVNEALSLPLWNSGVWLQFAVAILTAAVCLGLGSRPRSRVLVTLLLIVVGSDLLRAVPGAIGPTGPEMETVPGHAVLPSVHVRRLQAGLRRDHQRLLTLDGPLANDLVRGTFARLWQVPMASGYSSVQLDSIATLGMSSQMRAGDRSILGDLNSSLDLLAVKFVVVKQTATTDAGQAFLPSQNRWRELERFSTSSLSDRVVDEDVPGETQYVVFENRRALPRAWLAREVIPLTDGGLIDAAFASRLPGGRRFNAAEMALVDEGQSPPMVYPDGRRDVDVESVDGGSIRVRVSSGHGGFLVLSEAFYPGWRARIGDDPPQPVQRTNLALQGVHVPAGTHVIVFEFVSNTWRLGAVVSAAGVLLVAGLWIQGGRMRSSADGRAARDRATEPVRHA